MSPEQRIADCDRVAYELRGDMPWYCSSWRLRQQQENFVASQFSWFVSETRRVGNGADLWAIISDQLRDWEHNAVN
jgi:hypothetical protein